MKVPPHAYDATVAFYKDVLGFKIITRHAPNVVFEFGHNQLWIDRMPGLSQAEVWLEILARDTQEAARALEGRVVQGMPIVRCDEIEPLPSGFNAFWISSPASIVHLVCDKATSL
jgi:catechol 2,3-dioxygenase-like lactoylglutathione lyase family enzyme